MTRLSGFPMSATMKFLNEPACRDIGQRFRQVLRVGEAFPFDEMIETAINVLRVKDIFDLEVFLAVFNLKSGRQWKYTR